MSEITYRDAVDNDAAALATFARAAWLATFGHLPYPPDDLHAYLDGAFAEAVQRTEIADAATRYRLALRDAEIVGFCMMGALHLPVEDPEALELHRLYVHESVKGAGVADALIEDAITWARAQDGSAIYLSVWEKNFRAQRFYTRYGFAHHGEWAFMVGRVADRDFIWKLTL